MISSGATIGATDMAVETMPMTLADCSRDQASRIMARPSTRPAQPPSACNRRTTISVWTSDTKAAPRPASA